MQVGTIFRYSNGAARWMPITGPQPVRCVAHAVLVTDDTDGVAAPLCGRGPRLGEWDVTAPDRDFAGIPFSGRCFYCTAIVGQPSSRAQR